MVDACLTQADGHAERVAALHTIEPHAERPRRITLGAHKGYDAEDFVNELRCINVAPHVAAKGRRSAIDGRTTRLADYRISQVIRKRIEEAFGWAKAAAGLRNTRHCGLGRVRLAVHLHPRRLQPDQTAQAARRSRVSPKQRAHNADRLTSPAPLTSRLDQIRPRRAAAPRERLFLSLLSTQPWELERISDRRVDLAGAVCSFDGPDGPAALSAQARL